MVRQREARDDRSYGNLAESFIPISVQITLRCVGMAGRELEDAERQGVGNQVIVSVRTLLSHIRSGLQRPIREHEAWERDVGGGGMADRDGNGGCGQTR